MRANEFVKENPWLLEENMKGLREIISDAKDYKYFCLNNTLGHSYDNHGGGVAISIDDLKRIVASYKIVNFYGGIENAKETIKASVRSGYGPSSLTDINQAITDVEACQ